MTLLDVQRAQHAFGPAIVQGFLHFFLNRVQVLVAGLQGFWDLAAQKHAAVPLHNVVQGQLFDLFQGLSHGPPIAADDIWDGHDQVPSKEHLVLSDVGRDAVIAVAGSVEQRDGLFSNMQREGSTLKDDFGQLDPHLA